MPEGPGAAAAANAREPVYIINANPTAENLAKLIYDHAKRMRFPVTSVRLWETDSSFATYRP